MENRREPRIEHQIRFFVHVHDCPDAPETVGVSVACEAIDFSSHGMQLRTDKNLTADTLLNITIGIGDPFAMYLLRGQVRWSRPSNDEFLMGVMLIAEEGTDLDAWVEQSNQSFGV